MILRSNWSKTTLYGGSHQHRNLALDTGRSERQELRPHQDSKNAVPENRSRHEEKAVINAFPVHRSKPLLQKLGLPHGRVELIAGKTDPVIKFDRTGIAGKHFKREFAGATLTPYFFNQ